MFLLTKLNLSLFQVQGSKILDRIKYFRSLRLSVANFSSYVSPIRPRPLQETKFLKKDKIPNGYKIIYKAPMQYYLAAANAVTSTTSLLMISIIGYSFLTEPDLLFKSNSTEFGGLVAYDSDIIYFTIAFVLISICIQIVVKKYPLRIYRNQESYIAVFEGHLPFTSSKIQFKKGQVQQYNSFILNPWKDSMYKLDKTKALLIIEYFKTSSEFYDMLKR